ncbi:MAG: nucleotidyl transferase AbiEii/AbiGii toxin family protein, partial [Vicinamibacterales bacterium]
MKEQLLAVTRRAATPATAVNLAREYLQARILLAMQEAGAMIPLAFQGGTALRFLFDLPRFSEDLDFALERPGRGPFDIESLERRLTAQLEREGYAVVTTRKTGRAVQSVMASFPALLYEAGLSPRPAQRLSIRVEVDTKPPAGAGLETTIVRRHALLNLQHHDRPSLLAGKLHAILQRPWAKGRDLFDLFWYLSDPRWPSPNLVLLNNVLLQTGVDGPALDAASWRHRVRDRIDALDRAAVERDVAPFLEPGPTVS